MKHTRITYVPPQVHVCTRTYTRDRVVSACPARAIDYLCPVLYSETQSSVSNVPDTMFTAYGNSDEGLMFNVHRAQEVPIASNHGLIIV